MYTHAHAYTHSTRLVAGKRAGCRGRGEKERERYFNELVYMIMEAWQAPNLSGRLAGWRPREKLQWESKGKLLLEFSLR